MEPLTGYPKDVLPILVQNVYSIINDLNVTKFYIGRTVDPRRRGIEHDCDKLFPIYYTGSVYHAEEVEKYLIRRFYNHPKCENVARGGSGGVSEESGNYVYVYVFRWLNWYAR